MSPIEPQFQCDNCPGTHAGSWVGRSNPNIINRYLRIVLLSIDDFLKLRHTLPLADVRSEKEFGDGHIRGASNIPILNNHERVAVGTDYKLKGQAEAIKTGFRLVGPRFAEIINQAEKLAGGDELLVHCWRGGMRSSNFCQIIGMARIGTHQLEGGYKSYRARAMASYQRPLQLRIIGGFTGSGKSDILRSLARHGEQILDLEKLASHKGSAFGGLMMPAQPTTEQFQNELFEELEQLDPSKRTWVEDESIAIGKIFLPHAFWSQMSSAQVYCMEVEKSVRIERLVKEYGQADKYLFLEAMMHIIKKLGGQNFKEAKEKLFADDMAATIEILLSYYDKAYRKDLKRKQSRVIEQIAWDGQDTETAANALIDQGR